MTVAGTIRKVSLKDEESFKNLIGRSRRKDISSEGIREREWFSFSANVIY